MKTIKLGLFILIFLKLNVKAQISEQDLVLFKRSFETRITDKIKNDSYLKGVLPSSFTVQSIPFCYVSPENDLKNDIDNVRNNLRIDSASSYAILRDTKNQVLCSVYGFNLQSYTIEKVGIQKSSWEVRMIEKVSSLYSQDFFLISFSELDSNSVIGFYDKKNIKFLNRRMEIVNNIKDIVTQQVGSVEKFLENFSTQQLLQSSKEKLRRIDDIKSFLRNNYGFCMSSTPNDTIRVLGLLLDEIKRSANASAMQLEIIKSRILNFTKRKYLPPSNGSGVAFYGVDVELCVKSVLTENQFLQFDRQSDINSSLESWASNKMYIYLYRVKRIPQDRIKAAIIKEVFSE